MFAALATDGQILFVCQRRIVAEEWEEVESDPDATQGQSILQEVIQAHAKETECSGLGPENEAHDDAALCMSASGNLASIARHMKYGRSLTPSQHAPQQAAVFDAQDSLNTGVLSPLQSQAQPANALGADSPQEGTAPMSTSPAHPRPALVSAPAPKTVTVPEAPPPPAPLPDSMFHHQHQQGQMQRSPSPELPENMRPMFQPFKRSPSAPTLAFPQRSFEPSRSGSASTGNRDEPSWTRHSLASTRLSPTAKEKDRQWEASAPWAEVSRRHSQTDVLSRQRHDHSQAHGLEHGAMGGRANPLYRGRGSALSTRGRGKTGTGMGIRPST